MPILAAVLALLLLVIVLSPIAARRFRLARRERAVHLDGSCHWYANYDEDLRYEPQSGADILRVPREEVLRRGYAPTSEVQLIPRTFRHRVPGDQRIRLWKNGDAAVPSLWLCERAMKPIRVSIGVGDREKVPGVESGRVPTRPELSSEPPRTLGELDLPERAGDSAPKPEATSAVGDALLSDATPVPEEEVTRESSNPEAPLAEEMAGETARVDDTEVDGVIAGEPGDQDSRAPEQGAPESAGRGRSKRRRRRQR